MRVGIKKSKLQSFISLVNFIYTSIYNIKITTENLKKFIIENISLDVFITLQNGNLINVFEPTNLDNPKIDKVDTTFIDELVSDENKRKIVGSYLNFIDYIKSNNEKIDHTYLWDFITKPGLFCETGLNLIILNAPDNDITNKIQLVCPTNVYSNEIFDINKPTILVYSNNNYYEPIVRYKKIDKNFEMNFLFNFKNLNTEAPEIVRIMRKIKENMLLSCKNLSSLPIKYNNKNDFVNNITSYEISKIIKEIPNLNIISQIVNNNMKVIGLTIENNETNKFVYLPVIHQVLMYY
jgi:hypothetical protein